ncbi:MAG: hypothetical protein AMS24_00275 [Chlamydiae bacterium SM23_39]|nr:MAG: hypothetical protein AMS24_00275 [Chlamydiae bacterium SM23_39]
MDIEKYKKDFILFVEAGFIAINQADETSAVKLFKAAELLEPKNILTKIGFGYLYLHKLELDKSIEYFKKALEIEPKNEMAKTFLGIALSWTPKKGKEGESILEKTKQSKDSQIKDLSITALDFVEKFIKKEPSPAEIKKK